MLRIVTALTLALALGGCVQSTTTIRIKPDGSGTIEQTTTLSEAAVAQLKQMAAGFGADPTKDLFTEAQAKQLAAQMGEGVTFVSSTPVGEPGRAGRTNVYAFADVTKLRLPDTPQAPGGASISVGGSHAGALSFALSHAPDNHAVLTASTPQTMIEAITAALGKLGNRATAVPPDQLATATQMLSGLRVAFAVEPATPLLRTTSRFVDGQRVTLLAVDGDELLKDPTLLARVQAAKTPEEIAAIVRGAPGVQVNADREVVIEFAAPHP